jgi:hypothetical protein
VNRNIGEQEYIREESTRRELLSFKDAQRKHPLNGEGKVRCKQDR